MPPSDHAVSQRQRADNAQGRNEKQAERKDKAGRRGRLGTQLETSNSPSSMLRPIISHLPSFSSVPSFGGLLPAPNKAEKTKPSPLPSYAAWQEADLGDGRGKRPLLLVSSPRHALQIFAGPSSALPDDPHVQERFQPPEEIFNLPRVRYDESAQRMSLHPSLHFSAQASAGDDTAIFALLLPNGPLWEQHGPVAALCTVTRRRKADNVLKLVIISLWTGIALKCVDLGAGNAASIAGSPQTIVVAVSHPSPSLHILDPSTLAPLHPSIHDLPPSHRTSLPVFTLTGRLLAYITNTPPLNIGPDGLGSVITFQNPPRARPSTSDGSLDRTANAHASSSQAILASAVGIGGGVAKGVWAGIKYGAKAAQNARPGKLGSSAPDAPAQIAEADAEVEVGSEGSDTRSIEETDLGHTTFRGKRGGVWIKIVDLCPRWPQALSTSNRRRNSRAGHRPSTSKADSVTSSVIVPDGPITLAHFRLPVARSLPTNPAHLRPSAPCPVGHLSFSPQGTHLLAAQGDGRAAHVFELHPLGLRGALSDSDIKGCVWHTHEMKRGNTIADICDVQWDKLGRWVALGTARGTTHVFPLNLNGHPADARSHTSLAPQNPIRIQSLHTIVSSAARLHPPSSLSDLEAPRVADLGVPYFGGLRTHPLDKSTCLDLYIYRPLSEQLELARLLLTKRQKPEPDGSPKNGARRSSALTELMRASYGGTQTDLAVKGKAIARWALPVHSGEEGDSLLLVAKAKPGRPRLLPPVSSLARAEIQTHIMSTRIMPKSIYLSHQMDFLAARAIDEYSPLSILDPEARTGRLLFREEVEAHAAAEPGSPVIKSFDEPLMTALHSIMDSPPDTQLPGLPNGHRKYWQSATIPIRHVASGLGEGVGKVRREYVRAQHIRQKRRASEVAANKLSFEEDVVLPPPAAQLSGSALDDVPLSPDRERGFDVAADNGSGSLPSSGAPSHSTDSSNETPLEGWTEEWEEEYAKAVEDDGAPEELVLGLMDEEQEERRRWMEKREDMKREWSRQV